MHISTLTDADSLQFERDRIALVGRHSGLELPGDRVLVKVASVNVARRELDFRLVKALGKADDAGGEFQQRLPQSRRSGPQADHRPVPKAGHGRGESPLQRAVRLGGPVPPEEFVFTRPVLAPGAACEEEVASTGRWQTKAQPLRTSTLARQGVVH